MDVLLRRLESYCTLWAYADNLLLLCEGESRNVLETKGAQLMSIVKAWGMEVGAAVSTSKTVIMLLKEDLRHRLARTSSRALGSAAAVKFAGANLPYVSSCR